MNMKLSVVGRRLLKGGLVVVPLLALSGCVAPWGFWWPAPHGGDPGPAKFEHAAPSFSGGVEIHGSVGVEHVHAK